MGGRVSGLAPPLHPAAGADMELTQTDLSPATGALRQDKLVIWRRKVGGAGGETWPGPPVQGPGQPGTQGQDSPQHPQEP